MNTPCPSCGGRGIDMFTVDGEENLCPDCGPGKRIADLELALRRAQSCIEDADGSSYHIQGDACLTDAASKERIKVLAITGAVLQSSALPPMNLDHLPPKPLLCIVETTLGNELFRDDPVWCLRYAAAFGGRMIGIAWEHHPAQPLSQPQPLES